MGKSWLRVTFRALIVTLPRPLKASFQLKMTTIILCTFALNNSQRIPE